MDLLKRRRGDECQYSHTTRLMRHSFIRLGIKSRKTEAILLDFLTRDLHGAPPPRQAAVYRGIYRGAGDYLAVLPRYGVIFPVLPR